MSQDDLYKKAEQSFMGGGRGEGSIDPALAARLVDLADEVKRGGPPSKKLAAFLQGGSATGAWGRHFFPDDASFDAAQELAGKALARYSDADIKDALASGPLKGTHEVGSGTGDYVFPDDFDARAPAYAKFLRDRVGARSEGEHAASKKAPAQKPAKKPKPPAPGGEADVKATAGKIREMVSSVGPKALQHLKAGGDVEEFLGGVNREIDSLGLDSMGDDELRQLADEVEASAPIVRLKDRNDPAKVRQAQINEIKRVVLIAAESMLGTEQ